MKKFILLLITIVQILFSQSLTDSLKAYYPFSGNANDQSGYGNHAVNYGAVTVPDRYSQDDNAYYFNGFTNYMIIGDPVPEVLQIQDEITLSAWIYLTSYSESSYKSLIIGSPGTGASVFMERISSSGIVPGYISFYLGSERAYTDRRLPLNQWVLITATAKAGETAKLYYNNVEQPLLDNYIWSGNLSYDGASMSIGGQNGFGDRYFKGKIDEARVYSRSLSNREIEMLYSNYHPPKDFTAYPESEYIKLTWDASEFERLEKVFIFRDGAMRDSVIISGAGDSIYTDTGLVPDNTYLYSISSADTSGCQSIRSKSVEVTASFIPFTELSSLNMEQEQYFTSLGDYDSDGDMDILITGSTSEIFRNNGDLTFTDIDAGLGTANSCEWGDFDNDGDLDILFDSGKIYRNDGNGTFTDIDAGLTGSGSCAWGDFDNDGDLDILTTGYPSKVYCNNGDETFTDINAGLTGASSCGWGDYENDGDLDILLAGYLSKVYRNNGDGTFTDISVEFHELTDGSCDWGDYDNDGDLDILYTGMYYEGRISASYIYRNDSGVFAEADIALPGVIEGSTKWGDFDNDGDLDIIISGYDITSNRSISKLFANNSGMYFERYSGFPVSSSSNSLGDIDNDGDIDVIMSGFWDTAPAICRNNWLVPNNAPDPPSNIFMVQNGTIFNFSYDQASDAETPASGLTYNIDINIGDGTVKTASSDLSTGYKRIPSSGNVKQNSSWTLKKDFPSESIPQELYEVIWRVQAVDNCFAGSLFETKIDTIMNRNLITVPKNIMTAADVLTWEYYLPSDSISGYTLQLNGDSLFADPYEIYLPKDNNNKTVYTGIDLLSLGITDSLENNGTYFWRVKPEHINPANKTGFKKVPDSFIYDPVYSAPSPVSITVEGNYVTLQWGSGKEAGKGEIYNIYSSDDPYAVFPSGWTLLISGLNATEWTVKSTAVKKFYCVTAAGSVK